MPRRGEGFWKVNGIPVILVQPEEGFWGPLATRMVGWLTEDGSWPAEKKQRNTVLIGIQPGGSLSVMVTRKAEGRKSVYYDRDMHRMPRGQARGSVIIASIAFAAYVVAIDWATGEEGEEDLELKSQFDILVGRAAGPLSPRTARLVEGLERCPPLPARLGLVTLDQGREDVLMDYFGAALQYQEVEDPATAS